MVSFDVHYLVCSCCCKMYVNLDFDSPEITDYYFSIWYYADMPYLSASISNYSHN